MLWTESMEGRSPLLAARPERTHLLARWREDMLNRWTWPQVDLGLSLGSSELVVDNGRTQLRQSARAAVDTRRRIVALGQAARAMEGREPEGVSVTQPIREGVVADFERSRRLLASCLRAARPVSLGAPRVVLAVLSDLTAVEHQTLVEVTRLAGAREIHLVDQALAAALGAGREVLAPRGTMVVHVGAGAAQAAVISLGHPVVSRTCRIASDAMNTAIVEHVRRTHNLLIDDDQAELLKRGLGCALPPENPGRLEVAGRELNLGKPVKVTLDASEIYTVLQPIVGGLVTEARAALAALTPELLRDVVKDGAVLTGGGAQLRGLAELLSQETRVHFRVADEPDQCVARGLRRLLRERVVRKAILTPREVTARPAQTRSPLGWMVATLLLSSSLLLSLYSSELVKAGQINPLDDALTTMIKPALVLASGETGQPPQMAGVVPPGKALAQDRERRLMTLAAENRRLQRLFGRTVTSTDPLVKPMLARVVARDPRGWLSTLTLDVGRKEGIEPGMVVTSSQGLVGQVITCDSQTSRVRMFTDPESLVAGTIVKRKASGVLVGRSRKTLDMRYLDPDSGVSVGDFVVTSGMDGLYPAGLAVGRVTRVQRLPDTSFDTVTVTPASDFDSLREVLVLREKPRTQPNLKG